MRKQRKNFKKSFSHLALWLGGFFSASFESDNMANYAFEPDPLTASVIGAAIEVHRHLGPGLLESLYEKCLCHELTLRGIPHERQVMLPISYKNLEIERSLIVDILVNRELILELKAVDAVLPIFEAQLLTYLKLGGFTRGLIINFIMPLLKNGIKRMVL